MVWYLLRLNQQDGRVDDSIARPRRELSRKVRRWIRTRCPSSRQVSVVGDPSARVSRISSFCSCIWSTPDMITFHGHSSGMWSTIQAIMAPGT